MNDQEQILEEISGFLHTYLKSGRLGINSFLSKTNLNIDHIEQLLMIRFLLKKETKTYVKALPHLLQNFKTTTTLRIEINVGEVRGAIHWPETIKTRLQQNYADPLTFSTTESIRSYETPENLVLKELLMILYKIVYENNYIQGFEKTDWFTEWTRLKVVLRRALKRNIYLKRVPFGRVSDRMIQKTSKHRNPLYKNAALLLGEYRKLMRGEYTENELIQLLQKTFITPDNEDVLFELYWVVQFIQMNAENSKLYLLDSRENLVASWNKDGFDYLIFHDSKGSHDIQFRVLSSDLAMSDHPYVKQIYESFRMSNHLIENFFNNAPNNMYWNGRPDFLVEVRKEETGELVRLMIGEVKNTQRKNYAATGMRELLDYIYLVKDTKGNYLAEKIPVEGILCLGDMTWNRLMKQKSFVRVVSRRWRHGILL